MFTKLYLKDFRIFKDKTINIAKTITAIAGQNATGKSTILSIIGNSAELKAKDGKTITNERFRTEFSEIVKGSKEYDKSGVIGYLYYNDNNGNEQKISLRTTWQRKDKTSTEQTRFRIIPKREINEKTIESKLPIPVFYLGLSRLYPLGEIDDERIQLTNINKNINDNDKYWLIDNYKKILSLDTVDIKDISSYKTDEKFSGGINTEIYDYITNSAGQDNLMQIMYVILSFKKLKETFNFNSKKWDGGLIIIDEIDATLHPAAQIRLIDFLYKQSTDLEVQVLFTTHSLQILKHLNEKNNKSKDISICYLTTANTNLEIKINPNYKFMENDMLISNFYDNIISNQITVYSEDAETRWMFKYLLRDYINTLNIIDTKLGADTLLSLLYNDSSYFKNVLFILDGDKTKITGKYKSLPEEYRNILFLPGEASPEEVIYNYLINLPTEHEILKDNADNGISIRSFNEINPLTNERYKSLSKNRDKYKHWFNDYLDMLNDIDVLKYWKRDNAQEYNKFIEEFIVAYNIVASRCNLPKIR